MPTKIKGEDNLPILGWLMLGGKCRTCSLSISYRYPLVETWFGLLAAALFLFEAIGAASNLPYREVPEKTGIIYIIWGMDREVLSIYLFHFALLSSLATLALFKLDRNRVPILAGFFFVLASAIPPVLQPYFYPVAGHSFSLEPLQTTGLSLVVGATAGIVMGLITEWLTAQAGINKFPNKGFWLAVGITGMALGWQAMLSSVMIFSVIFFFSRFASGQFFLATGPLLGMYNVAVLLQICLWKSLAELPLWPGASSDPIRAVSGIVFAAGMLLASSHLIPTSDEPEEFEAPGYGEEVPEVVATFEAATIQMEAENVVEAETDSESQASHD